MTKADSNSFADFYMNNKQPHSETDQPTSDDANRQLRMTEDFTGPGAAENPAVTTSQNPFQKPGQPTEVWQKQDALGANPRGPAVTEDFNPQSAPSELKTSWQNLSQSTSTEDQQSIADYMNQLLERVNDSVDAAADDDNPAPTTPTMPLPTNEDMSQTVQLEEGDSSDPITVEVRLPKRAPEDRDGLNSMRQVANASASDALKTYDCRQLIGRAYGNIVFIFAAIMLSSVLALVSSSVASLAYVGAILSMFSAMVGIFRFQMLSRQLTEAVRAESAEQQTEHA